MSIAQVFLLVALTSMGVYTSALRTQIHARSSRTPAERLTYTGLVRTASCRVTVGIMYVFVGVVEVRGWTGATLPLVVFTLTQSLWMTNALLDVHLRRRIAALPGILDLR